MAAPSIPSSVQLVALAAQDRSAWLSRMETAFTAGIRDAGLQPGDQPIPLASEMDDVLSEPGGEAFEIVHEGRIVGGAAVGAPDGGRRSLELLFVDAGTQGAGIGAMAWRAIEARFPDTEVWETETPYFDQRNIHFYINRCGFHAVEFIHPGHRPDGEDDDDDDDGRHPGPDRMFRFEKRMPTRHGMPLAAETQQRNDAQGFEVSRP